MIKNLKKVISTLAAVAILASSASAFAAFPDVDASASYAGSVDALTALGIVNGDENGKFNPDNSVTRAEFAKMVVESMGEGNAAASSTTTKFTDAANHWAAGYIEVGVSKGFINGYDDTTFGPDDQVTYAQAVKMLVAAIGYDTYASKQGGWPSGYLAYGSSLDIIKGVTGVTNDTALTRAQCAVLIYNTLKAPICKVDGYEENYKGELVPQYKEMDGTRKDWQTLLTSKHDAYVVRGRVMEVYKKDAEVKFNVEAAENFDGLWIAKAGDADDEEYPETMNIGTTNAADMLYVYSEAIVQKDEDTSEFTLISITPYGSVKTVEFAATDISMVEVEAEEEDEENTFVAVDASDTDNPVISVKKEGTSRKTTYKLEKEYKVYINGLTGETVTADDIAAALTNENKRGTVTLIDKTETGSTSTNGKYDIIMVDYYVAAKVVDVVAEEGEEEVTIDTSEFTLTWTPEDEDAETTVDIYKDGERISYADVKVDDIVLVRATDMDAIDSSEWVELTVSDKVVEGTVTGRSKKTDKMTVKVDGTDYEMLSDAQYDTIEIGTSYTMWLDAMDFVYDVEEGEGSKTLGVVLSVYKKAGDDNATVRLVDGTGETVEYELKDADTTEDLITDLGGTYVASAPALEKPTADNVMNRVIKYTLSGGKLKYDSAKQDDAEALNDGEGEDEVEYRASSSRLGKYTISNTATTIVDMEAYLDDNGAISIFSADSFEDEGNYTAYVYDRNSNTGVCGFVILTSGINSLAAKSTMAVVMTSGEYANNEEGTECELITVARNGEEDIEVLLEKDSDRPALAEGAIIMYTVGSEGYVEDDKIKIVHNPADEYSAMMTTLLAKTTFTSAAANALVTEIMEGEGEDATGTGEFTLALPNAAKDEVEIFYGPVYKASTSVLEMFKTQADGKSSVLGTESFTLAGANTYKVNFNKEAGYGERVSKGTLTQDSTTFTSMFDAEDTDKEFVVWNKLGARKPATAFVRVVDGYVTDVVYYTAR